MPYLKGLGVPFNVAHLIVVENRDDALKVTEAEKMIVDGRVWEVT